MQQYTYKLSFRRRHRLSIFVCKCAVIVLFTAGISLFSSGSQTSSTRSLNTISEIERDQIELLSSNYGVNELSNTVAPSLATRGLPADRTTGREKSTRILLEQGLEEGVELGTCGEEIEEQEDRCGYVMEYCDESEGMINYIQFHYCTMDGKEGWSVFALIWIVLYAFYLLGDTAEEFFCPVVKQLTNFLDLSPNTAGVTFLALGNGAPDVFASLAAFVSGDGKIGLGAIISAGSFVAAFVVGSVAVAASPFDIDPVPYVRDVVFYLVAALGVFYVCFQGTVHVHHSVLFVLYYLVYVIVVMLQDRWAKATPLFTAFTSDFFDNPTKGIHTLTAPTTSSAPTPPGQTTEKQATKETTKKALHTDPDPSLSAKEMLIDVFKNYFTSLQEMSPLMKFKTITQTPVDILRHLTVPTTDPEEWNKLVAAMCTICVPTFLLFNCRDMIPLDYPLLHIHGGTHVPLWALVLLQSTCLGVTQFHATEETSPPPWLEAINLGVAFVTSIAWISLLANELLGCLSALGVIMGISSSILGITVLAWGNSIGDLVADVVIARSGQPKMAVAGCYAGPMFNMLIGLGLALTIKTVTIYPAGYELHYHPNVPISFGFLFATLIGSLFAVGLSGYRITKPWGICLILLYILFMIVSVLVETHVLEVGYL